MLDLQLPCASGGTIYVDSCEIHAATGHRTESEQTKVWLRGDKVPLVIALPVFALVDQVNEACGLRLQQRTGGT